MFVAGWLLPISSEMVGARELKLGGLIEGMGENVLAKKFVGSVNIHHDK